MKGARELDNQEEIKKVSQRFNGDLARFLDQVRASYDSLPKRLQELAAYSFHHPDNMALDSITELAHRTGSHPSTFVRYAKHFGFSGFSELQRLYREHIRTTTIDYRSRLDHIDNSNTGDILDAISQSAMKSANDLKSSIDSKEIAQAVELIANARTVWLVGGGRTQAVQYYFNYLFTGLGMVSHCVGYNLDQVVRYVGLMGSDDVVIATSFHPYNQATVETITEARKTGIPCVCLTDTDVSPIYGSVSLIYSEDQFSGFRSLSATMSLALYLAIEAGRQRNDAGAPAKRKGGRDV